MTECSNCSKPGATRSVTVNNSNASHWNGVEESTGISENQVRFEVSMDGLDMVSVTICESCYQNNDHLTEEYRRSAAYER